MSYNLPHKALVHLNIPFPWLKQQTADYLKPTKEDLRAARSTHKSFLMSFLKALNHQNTNPHTSLLSLSTTD